MTPQEISQIIMIARRAPLANMAEAEAVAQLLQKLAVHFAPPKPSEGVTNPLQSSEQ
jgi:hypothetical protein